jgi:hypothetical protein
MSYFCAKLLTVCLVEDGQPRKRNTCDRSFVLVQAPDSSSAMELALKAGKGQETRYKNARGQKVRWAFVGVEELKERPGTLAGAEVGSVLGVMLSSVPLAFGKRFNPQRIEPLLS